MCRPRGTFLMASFVTCVSSFCLSPACGHSACRLHVVTACGHSACRLHVIVLRVACMWSLYLSPACGHSACRLHVVTLRVACMWSVCMLPACGHPACCLHVVTLRVACMWSLCLLRKGGGVFILDPGSATNKWSLISTRSNFMITMPKSVLKVTVLSHVDETGFRPLRIDFRPGESPLSNSEARYTGNIGSDEFMQSLVHYKMDSNSNRVRGGKRGGKGGKGRKGGKQGGKKGGKATPFSDF